MSGVPPMIWAPALRTNVPNVITTTASPTSARAFMVCPPVKEKLRCRPGPTKGFPDPELGSKPGGDNQVIPETKVGRLPEPIMGKSPGAGGPHGADAGP